MNTPRRTIPSTGRATRRSRAAFTLAELIVAVAAVALLTVGIGQIFSSVGRLVGTGAAVAETDQFARAFEQQIRADFAALSRLRAEDTFIAIRNRKLGDYDGNGALDAGEKVVYLNSEARDADRRNAVDPYRPGSAAITVRLDEIVFIASADGESATAQRLSAGQQSPVDADHVRIYYGHGLRPPRVPGFDPRTTPPAGWMSNVPPRLWFPDGDFADRAGINNRYYPGGLHPSLGTYDQVTGRNEFAGDWLLLRQPLYLAGGLVSGYAGTPVGGSWTFSPFIRGLECTLRSWEGYGTVAPMNSADNATPAPPPNWPFPRVLYHGRTDLCAQTLTDARRWLEGLDAGVIPTAWSDATAFSAGRLDEANPIGIVSPKWDVALGSNWPQSPAVVDAPLWKRDDSDIPANNLDLNHQRLISAVAGAFARFQADDVPPLLDRGDSLVSSAATPYQPGAGTNTPPPALAFMDQHAIIASRVSSFEVAWTDGKRWLYDAPYDRNGDGDTNDPDDLRRGDLIWYDIDFTRYDNPFGPRPRNLREADPGNVYQTSDDAARISEWPEVFPGARTNMLDVNVFFPGRYDVDATGADPDPDGSSEYLAVFPFRRLDGLSPIVGSVDGAWYSSPYPKPTMVRIRMIVHDGQFRIPGGRQHEFILSVDLK